MCQCSSKVFEGVQCASVAVRCLSFSSMLVQCPASALLSSQVVVYGHSLAALPITMNETLKWLSSLPILMQKSLRW